MKLKKEKEELKKELANTAGGDKDGVWMAIANGSGDELTDSEFNDFTIFKDNLLFFEDKDTVAHKTVPMFCCFE